MTWTSFPRSAQHKAKIAEALKASWNNPSDKQLAQLERIKGIRKGSVLSIETREKMAEAHRGNFHTVESKKLMAEKARRWKRSDEIKHRLATLRTGSTASEETRDKMSDSARRRWQRITKKIGTWYPTKYYCKDGSVITMRSTWETAFASWLDDQNLTWLYESSIQLADGRVYLPDFYVGDWEMYFEVKGWPYNLDKYTQAVKEGYLVLLVGNINDLGGLR